ncbi:FMN-binding protein [Kitasatospora sp. NPDC059646]|uniref:FMN-binding protein n=1 Tax=Kitasatospora sp. NPDC059646 TaxID=3346893 RepID=UPI003674480C
MRRAVITASATAAGVVLLLSLKPHEPSTTAAISSAPTGAAAGSSAPPSASAGAGAGAGTGTGTRTVTGSAVNTRYGPVQVKVTLEGSAISRIEVVQYPTRDRRDREINSYAVPQLIQEAMTAQSANVDVVSGATYTSDGYTRSLQSALDQAARK